MNPEAPVAVIYLDVKIWLGMEWSGSTICISLNGRRGDQGYLMMASGDMPKGRWESVRARWSGCEGLDDSSRPKVLALLVGVWRTKLSRCEEVTPGVVDGLRVSYLHWGGFKGTPLSKDGMVGVSGAWDVKSCGDEALGLELRDSEESVWPPLIHTMSKIE